MNPERKRSSLAISTAGLALIALTYFGNPNEIPSYGSAVQYEPEGIVVPFAEELTVQREDSVISSSDFSCGPYPDDTDDPYLPEQKALIQDITFNVDGEPIQCSDQYIGYDFIARRLEEQIPEADRRPVTLVIMDSGINGEHEDWCEGQIDRTLSKTFLDSVQNDTSPLTDEFGHGSAVAGIAAACTGNGVGIASLGRGLDIASIKVMFPYGGGGIVNPSDWESALEYLDKRARIDSGRQFVLNMSFAGFGEIERIGEIIANFPDNMTVFAGAGNNHNGMPQNSLDYPAAYDRLYAVGATVDESPDTLCGFSYYSTAKDRFITAPGCFDLWGFNSINDGSFPYRDGLSGTSFSTPNMSGMYSYFLHIFPMLEPDDIMKTIYDTSLTVQQSSQGSLDGPVQAISPLQAIQALTVKAGYEDILKSVKKYQSFMPFVAR